MTGTALRHGAFVYDEDEQFVTRMSGFLEDGLDEGAAAVVITTRSNWAGIRDSLGDRASSVSFTDRDSIYVRPANTIAIYAATLRHHLQAGASSVRLVGEVQFGPTPAEWDEWTSYEAIANRALARYPAWIVCPYDARVLPEPVVEQAWRTHPEVTHGEDSASTLYHENHADLVRSLTPDFEPLPDLGFLAPVRGAAGFRDAVAAALHAARVSEAKKLDMLVAANEVFANAVQHARGVTVVRAGIVHGRFVLEVSDQGPGHDDPLAGYLPPAPEEDRGAGLWVVRQLVSKVELRSSPHGLTVRLWL
ncbi:MAG: hypothetical protein QOH76_1112 [Thermoleophilaceae bacterium]|nr:hypothetical protein [Thermoleophilaceae bacterium]